MIRPLLRIGHDALREPAQPVTEFNTPELTNLIIDLKDTMKANGGVGIAAPQIGVPLCVIVIGFTYSDRYPHAKSIPEMVLINPSYHAVGDETYEDWEGCLSLKKLRGLVRRYVQITYSGFTATGEKVEDTVSGFHAKVIQHEVDHLRGTLLIERVPDLKFFGFEDEIQVLMQQTGTRLS